MRLPILRYFDHFLLWRHSINKNPFYRISRLLILDENLISETPAQRFILWGIVCALSENTDIKLGVGILLIVIFKADVELQPNWLVPITKIDCHLGQKVHKLFDWIIH